MPTETQSLLPLNGTIGAAIIHDFNGIPTPSTVIQSTDAFVVHVDWNINGAALSVMDGTFKAMAFFEHIGVDVAGGPTDAQFGPVSVPFANGSPAGPGLSKNYIAHIPVPAGALKAGAYDMVCLLTFVNNLGLPGNIASYTEEQVIQVYVPHPSLT